MLACRSRRASVALSDMLNNVENWFCRSVMVDVDESDGVGEDG